MLNRPLAISVLNPTATFSDDINQNSLVLKMTYGSVSFLFMGDANADAESRVANNGKNLQAYILKIGHHGSATSSSSAFLTKDIRRSASSKSGPGIPTVTQISNTGPPGLFYQSNHCYLSVFNESFYSNYNKSALCTTVLTLHHRRDNIFRGICHLKTLPTIHNISDKVVCQD